MHISYCSVWETGVIWRLYFPVSLTQRDTLNPHHTVFFSYKQLLRKTDSNSVLFYFCASAPFAFGLISFLFTPSLLPSLPPPPTLFLPPFPASLVAHFKLLLSHTVTSNNRDPAFSEARRLARRLHFYARIWDVLSTDVAALWPAAGDRDKSKESILRGNKHNSNIPTFKS